MFQSIYYCRQQGPDKNHFFLRDDKQGFKRFKYSAPKYILDDDGDLETLFGKRATKIEGQYDWHDPTILEKDVSKELSVLRDLYYKEDNTPSYHNIVYLDIEIQILGSLTPSYIQQAIAEITSIALLDNNSKQKICFIVDKENTMKDVVYENKQVIVCYSERDLINKFLEKWKELDPTIVVGWNSDYFDIPYLYYRLRNVFGEETANMLSPIKKISINLTNTDNPITIGGINSLDFMRLTKKYITKEEPSYKLNDIGVKYAKIGKIEYEGNLDQLLESDPEKYVDYNIRDVEIIEKLEENLQFITLTILISHLCHTPYESIYYNTVLNEGAILTYLKRKNIVVHNKPTTYNSDIKDLNIGDYVNHQRNTPTVEGEIVKIDGDYVDIQIKGGEIRTRELRTVKKKESYAGGFLLDPKPGIYRWLSDFDYASLYPSIIRSLNLGIETLVGRIVIDNPTRNLWWGLEDLKRKNPKEEVEFELLDTETYTFRTTKLTIEKLIQTIESKKWTISANGVCFRTDKKSIVATILGDWFAMRKEYKHKMELAYKDGNEELGALYDRQQHAIKILLNAVYGAFAINSWRFTDGYKILSSAITCTGQRMIQETIKYTNELIDERYLN
jgi:DNA polymerase elongation subunit (family B)